MGEEAGHPLQTGKAEGHPEPRGLFLKAVVGARPVAEGAPTYSRQRQLPLFLVWGREKGTGIPLWS